MLNDDSVKGIFFAIGIILIGYIIILTSLYFRSFIFKIGFFVIPLSSQF